MLSLLHSSQPLLLTLKVALLATFFSFLVGVAVAALLSRGRFAGRDWLDAFLTLPLVLPPWRHAGK
jgi:molybdate transport system permease protein